MDNFKELDKQIDDVAELINVRGEATATEILLINIARTLVDIGKALTAPKPQLMYQVWKDVRGYGSDKLTGQFLTRPEAEQFAADSPHSHTLYIREVPL